LSQNAHSAANREGYNHKSYEAWSRGYGTPEEAAQGIVKDPEYIIRDYRDHLSDLDGKRIVNLLGSHGRRAVALSRLGAKVTVVDISSENRRYALEVAEAAGVGIDYIVSDLLEWDTSGHLDYFDHILMEYGILHYFLDLEPLARLIHSILSPGGTMILHEFHPIIKKCRPGISGGDLLIDGSYFSEEIFEYYPPYHGEFSPEEIASFPNCRYKYWQLGEVITAVATAGLVIQSLVEHPHSQYSSLPGTYALVCKKPVA
jgi:2-polyprenyl-3-methyl-5-hydroxy-6-metoxy-1,4-benzoquinol methylase